jgi:hypothetical protein
MWKESGSTEYEQLSAGTYNAVCYRVIDIGTQEGSYEGKATSRRQCIIQWEVDEPMEDKRRFQISAFVTASLSEKAKLRQWLASWRGRDFTETELRGFDPRNIVSQPCMLSVKHNDKEKAVVAGVAKLPKGMQPMKPENEAFYFSLEPDEFDPSLLDKISQGLQKFILQSPEYAARTNGKAPYSPGSDDTGGIADMDDDLPFK